MKILDVKQGSPEWLKARLGIPTASEFDALVTPLWKVREGAGVDTYLAKKLAEKWRGEPLNSYCGGAMEQGHLKEPEALTWYEFTKGVDIQRVGFITTDDGRVGCSPDGLLPDGGIEIKCPEPHTHVSYLLDGTLPKDYLAQVQGGMFVAGRDRWEFLSYCRGMPNLLLEIKRDDKAIDAIRTAVEAFNKRLDEAYARLVDMNDGPPDPPEDVEVRTMDGISQTAIEDHFRGVLQ